MMRAAIGIVLVAGGLLAQDWQWGLPQGFPKPPVPASNPMSAAKVELGRHLFYDQRLSVNGKQACASCHRQELAFTDGRARGEGTTGEVHPRGSMSLVNVAYAASLTWANPGLTALEEQARTPMFGEHPVELGLKGREAQMLAVLRRDVVYQRLFGDAFGGEFSVENVTRALAAFQRSIVSLRSPYDRYRWGGEADAISPAAKRGELIYSSGERGGCFQCHGGWNFSGGLRFAGASAADGAEAFHNTGVSGYAAPNRGLAEHTGKPEDVGKFRAPTLRNIAVTAPYMHDGSLATLEDVIAHYAAGGRLPHANKSLVLGRLKLTAADQCDLVAFLQSLTDDELLRDPRWADPWPAARPGIAR